MDSYNTNPEVFQTEPLDAAQLLTEIVNVCKVHGWTRLPANAKPGDILLFHRPGKSPRFRIYISAGIHGNEPGGPSAILELLKENAWPDEIEVYLYPCLNPYGLLHNSHENEQGIDLNFDYREPQAVETQQHIASFKSGMTFDVALCLHENWDATGFFLYETNVGNQSLARKIIMRVAEVCPIDRSEEIRGRAAQNGLIAMSESPEAMEKWSEAHCLLAGKSSLVYTFVVPSNRSLNMRVNAFMKAIRAVLDGLKG